MKAVRFSLSGLLVFLSLGCFAAAPPTTNVWSVAEASSLSFEFRFVKPKDAISFMRVCDEKNPRVRIQATLAILPKGARSTVWNAETGRAEGRTIQTNLGAYGHGEAFETNVWYRARIVSRENSSALLVEWAGAWRELAFFMYDRRTTECFLRVPIGAAEVRNVKRAPARGRARVQTIDANGEDIVAELTTGYGTALLRLDLADGTEQWKTLAPRSENYWCTRKEKNGSEKWYSRTCRDGVLLIDNPTLKVFSPARVWAHRPSDRAAAIDDAENNPDRCAPRVPITLRFGADGSYWVNGRYQGTSTNRVLSAMLYVPEIAPTPGRLSLAKPRPVTDTMSFDLADCCGAKRTDDGRVYLDISEHAEHSDPGQETDHYFDRDGLDGFTDSFVWSIPNRCWAKARLVAAVKPKAPTNDVPIVTVRLARNSFAGYGDACAEGQVNLLTAPRKPAGTVVIDGITVPLFAYDVTIPVGQIQDRLYVKRGSTKYGNSPYLHVDIVGPLGRPGVLWDKSHKPDWKRRSTGLLFGLELVKSPCEMELLQSVPGLIFGDDEKRTTDVRVKANKAGKYLLTGTIGNWWQKKVRTFKVPLTLAAGEEKRVPIDLQMPEEGWYSLDLSLAFDSPLIKNFTQSILILHRAAFADVGRDTRKAGYESPYAWWWHGAHHGGTADLSIMGPIFRKMGIRRISCGDGTQTEASMKEYGLTLSQIPFNINLAMGKKPLAQKVTEYEAWLRKLLADFPHVERRALVFHESYCKGGYPYYLWGLQDRKWKEADFAEARQRVELGVALCKMMREKFPDIKIQLGNSSTSYELLDALFRQKFPTELFDKLGSETVARFTMPDLPESSSAPNSLWFLNRVADHYGYPQRADCCYEWASHLPRELGPFDTVEWAMRDTLLAFANGATMVPIAGSTPDDAYFNSDYGGIATVDRYPYLYPTRSYVARSVLTKELDCARFTRRLETGSQTVTALEFKRANGECVYALWVPRGKATVRLVAKGAFGRVKEARPMRIVRSDAKRLQTIELSTLPVFVTLEKAALRAEIVTRETPGFVKPKNFQLANALTDASELSFETLENKHEKSYFAEKSKKKDGRFTVRQGKGCVEIVRDETLPAPAPLVSEFGYFAFKNPVVLKGEPATISVEVDGNSSWAELMFVLQDAEGKRHYPTGIAYEGDGRAHGRVNFDGWGTMQIPFSSKSRVKSSEVVPGGDHWRVDRRGKKNRDIVYPVSIIGVGVLMPRDTLSGGVYEPLKKDPNVLRLRNLGMFE